MTQLSLAMIVRDEEASLARCLQSVTAVCDEVVIVDTGSKDETVTIARSFGAEVLEHPWRDDFSDARNIALEATTRPWVLQLDADEWLDPVALPELTAAIRSVDVSAWNVAIKSDLPSGGVACHHYPRLFQRNSVSRYVGRIHERPLVEGVTRPASFEIRHAGYAIDPVAMRRKQARNLALLERWVAEEPDDPEARFHYATALLATGQHRAAATAARAAAYGLAGRGSSRRSVQAACWDLVGVAHLGLEEWRRADAALTRALDLEPDLVDAYFDLALAKHGRGDLRGAIAQYHAYFAARDRWHRANRCDLMLRTLESTAVAHHNLGVIYERLQDLESARASHRSALADDPRLAASRSKLDALTID